ncbi:tRNA pseudouridine(55) synthase TruB [Aquirhabdus sp.]|uniref:tRNA pseudouridine(55) synthase TruB n=1 Tax=Aquirhabdus sp. TaxID=2824160 RepID=UPI00396CAF19
MSDPRPKIARRAVSGVFLLNKPQGHSSNGILQKVRWLYRAQKAGHTGALDPLATGLLPICLGEATKFSHYLLDSDKTYQTIVKLGATTTTGDEEGEIVQEFAIPPLNDALIESVLAQFRGPIMQVPPMYSALKKDGRPLYELARQGIEIDRPARPVTIFNLELNAFDATTLTLTVKCSKGTYIRTLAEDIGAALGCGGHVAKLHRIQTASFVLDEHNTIEYLESLDETARDALLLPTYAAVEYLPRIDLSLDEAIFFSRGQAINAGNVPQGETLAFENGRFLGLGIVDKFRTLHPKRVVN